MDGCSASSESRPHLVQDVFPHSDWLSWLHVLVSLASKQQSFSAFTWSYLDDPSYLLTLDVLSLYVCFERAI